MDSLYKAIHPVKYLNDHLAEDVRPDGRKFMTFRPTCLNVHSIAQANGSSLFKIGNTSVICGIKPELATPKPDLPNHGFIVPNVELPPLCSPKFRPGPPSKQAQVTSKAIENVLLNSEVIDLSDLCIQENKLVWVLYCDLLCLNYDGSVLDACIGALMGALKTLTLPEVVYNIETDLITVNDDKSIPVPMKGFPVCTSYAVFKNQLLVVDPTDEEESLALAKFSIVIDGNEICYVHKSGGIPVSQELMIQSLTKSKKRAEDIQSLTITAINS